MCKGVLVMLYKLVLLGHVWSCGVLVSQCHIVLMIATMVSSTPLPQRVLCSVVRVFCFVPCAMIDGRMLRIGSRCTTVCPFGYAWIFAVVLSQCPCRMRSRPHKTCTTTTATYKHGSKNHLYGVQWEQEICLVVSFRSIFLWSGWLRQYASYQKGALMVAMMMMVVVMTRLTLGEQVEYF